MIMLNIANNPSNINGMYGTSNPRNKVRLTIPKMNEIRSLASLNFDSGLLILIF